MAFFVCFVRREGSVCGLNQWAEVQRAKAARMKAPEGVGGGITVIAASERTLGRVKV